MFIFFYHKKCRTSVTSYPFALNDDMCRILNATWSKYGHQFSAEKRGHDFQNYQDTSVTEYDFHEHVWSGPALFGKGIFHVIWSIKMYELTSK